MRFQRASLPRPVTSAAPTGAEFDSPGCSPAFGRSPDAGRSPGFDRTHIDTKPQRGATRIGATIMTLFCGIAVSKRSDEIYGVPCDLVAPPWGLTAVVGRDPGLRRASGRRPVARLHPGLSNFAPLGLRSSVDFARSHHCTWRGRRTHADFAINSQHKTIPLSLPI